eukprot:14534739-Ditylum_brightwellii.AAC.1
MTNTGVYKQLEQKTSLYTRAITTCLLQRQKVWITYKTIYLPIIPYSLPVLKLTRAECEKLQSKLYP